MTNSETEVAIIGGGAAGIAAGRRLRAAGIDCLLIDEQQDFRESMDALYDRLEAILAKGGDVPAANALEPGGRWTNLLTAVGTYISGAELNLISGCDFINYQDSEVNWSVIEG